MEEQNYDNIAQLLEQGKYDEAKKAIERLLEAPLTKEQQGEIAFNQALTYIRAKNEINKNFIIKAQEILKEIDELEKANEGEDTERKLQELREKIKNL